MATLVKIGDVYYSDLRMNGKRIRRALSSDKRFAENKLADLVKQRQAAKYGDVVGDISWDAFKTRYMAYSANKHPATHYIDQLAFRKLERAVPLTRIDSLSPERLEMFKGALQKEGLAIPTINRMLRAIKAAINKAIEWNLLENNPAYRRVKCFKEAKGRLRFFTAAEVTRILKECSRVWKTIVMLAYYAGLRRSEIYYLRVSNVDFANNRIHIEPSDMFTPKDFERRFVPMHPKLRDYLKANLNGGEYVMGREGPNLGSMSGGFRKIMKRTGIKGSLHTLRHTFASQCAMKGIDPRVLMQWLGHSNMETMQIYTHLTPEHLDLGIERLPEI
jgi:integrase